MISQCSILIQYQHRIDVRLRSLAKVVWTHHAEKGIKVHFALYASQVTTNNFTLVKNVL